MKDLDFAPETMLETLFSFLDPFTKDGVIYQPVFSYGSKEDLNDYLKMTKGNVVLPLIWLIYPTKEKRNRNNILLTDLRLMIATQGSESLLNKDRLQVSYVEVLYPIFYGIQKILRVARNTQVIDDEYDLDKYPKFGEFGKNETIEIWDVLTVDFSLRINEMSHSLIKGKNV